VDRRFHPFLMHNEQVKEFQERTGVKIYFNESDEVVVQGNKADVDGLLALVEEIYTEKARGAPAPLGRAAEAVKSAGANVAAVGRSWWHRRRPEQKRTSSTISINIPKKLHRFVIGPKGANIQEILKTTGEGAPPPPSLLDDVVASARAYAPSSAPAFHVHARVSGRGAAGRRCQ